MMFNYRPGSRAGPSSAQPSGIGTAELRDGSVPAWALGRSVPPMPSSRSARRNPAVPFPLHSFKPFFPPPSWDLEQTGTPFPWPLSPFPVGGCLVSLGLGQALHAPFLLQTPLQKLLLFLLLNHQFGLGFLVFLAFL